MARKFPKEIIVTIEDEGTDNPYFSVADDSNSLDGENRKAAVYKLVKQGRVSVTRRFES